MAPSSQRWHKLVNTLQISADYSVTPAGLQWRSNTLFIVATVAIGLFTDLFLYGLIVPILPFMLNDRLGIPESDVQPYVSGLLTAYAAASVLFSPVAGVLADRDLEHERNRQDGANEDNRDTEETPLLSKKEQDYYKISADQPAIAQKFKLLPCLKHPGLITAFVIAGVQAFLLGAFDATVPTVAEQYYTFSSLKSGLLFLPLGVSDFLLGPLFGWAVDRAGTKPVATFAYLYLVPILILLRIPKPCPSSPSSVALLASINPHEAPSSSALKALAACSDPKKQIAIWSTLLFLSGVGLAGTSAPSIVEAGAIVKKFHERNPEFFGKDGPYAQLYGLSSMVFSAGLTIGPLVAGALKEKIGYGDMNAVVAAVSGLTGVAAFVWIGGRVRWRELRRVREKGWWKRD
ncbi:putative membrane transporter [Diplodia seriata]|uniref:Putative membrane transporter n=1 Tax=Diplodia seriata TaxID=420778 RepID=A0A0G2EQ98_9PEZI|nr:putative membrane transporter [Diplodia seriata]